MGCSSSSSLPPQASTPQPKPVDATPILLGAAPPSGGNVHSRKGKFQIKLEGQWKDYDKDEHEILKRAYLVGQPNCKFQLRGQRYEYNFKIMKQKNLDTNKVRDIRPPPGMRPPKKPLLPTGPMIVITVRPGQAGKCITIADPNNTGQQIKVNVPKSAKPGSQMAVPIPAKGETVATVHNKQKSHSAAVKLAMGTGAVAAVGAVAVGGVILGDHLSDGTVAEAAGDVLGDDAGDVVAAATHWVEGAVADSADWVEAAVEDFPDWAEDAAADVGDFAEDTGDWLADAGEDIGDFVTDLF